MTAIPENIGQFYLGTETLPDAGTPVLYDAADLTTHAVIIGMTGSGKTGLGITLLEEAALDGIPVIAIDPKGDLGNLALNFPARRAADFAPYADAASLAQSGQTADAWAAATAQKWGEGIDASQQSAARQEALAAANPVHIYTPGGEHGLPLSLLAHLGAPDPAIQGEREAYVDYLDSTAAALLALVGEAGDSTSPAQLYLAHILKHHWDAGRDLDLAQLISEIQNPPMAQIGVLPVAQVYPAKARDKLALAFNNLLAAPGFSAWLQGAPLDSQQLLYDAQNRAQTRARLQHPTRLARLQRLAARRTAGQPTTPLRRAKPRANQHHQHRPPKRRRTHDPRHPTARQPHRLDAPPKRQQHPARHPLHGRTLRLPAAQR